MGDKNTVLTDLVQAREKVAIDRQWNGENSRSAAVYRDAYTCAEAYIRLLEKKIAAYEHKHEWAVASFADSKGFSDVRKCDGCGEYQMFNGSIWRTVEFKSA